MPLGSTCRELAAEMESHIHAPDGALESEANAPTSNVMRLRRMFPGAEISNMATSAMSVQTKPRDSRLVAQRGAATAQQGTARGFESNSNSHLHADGPIRAR